ncbi:hypothetical protein GOODEAATRI_026273, partial [Goodea atripinnis]
ASSFPCVVIYVMDTSRSVNPVTFMSNMLYACRYQLDFSVGCSKPRDIVCEQPDPLHEPGSGRILHKPEGTVQSENLDLTESEYRVLFLLRSSVGTGEMFCSDILTADRDYRPEYERLRRQLVSPFVLLSICSPVPLCLNSLPIHQVETQSRKQQEQLERLRKDLGAVDIASAASTGRRQNRPAAVRAWFWSGIVVTISLTSSHRGS